MKIIISFKGILSELQEVDLTSSYFLFSFDLFSVFLFLVPRVRVSDDIGHMTQRKVLER